MVHVINKFPDTFQTVTDRGLFGVNTLTKMVDEFRLHRTSKALTGTVKFVAIGQTVMKAMFQLTGELV